MSDGHFGRMSVVKHCIELKSDEIRHVHCAKYKAGRRATEIENREIDKLLKGELLNQLIREGTLPQRLLPRRTCRYTFASTIES